MQKHSKLRAAGIASKNNTYQESSALTNQHNDPFFDSLPSLLHCDPQN